MAERATRAIRAAAKSGAARYGIGFLVMASVHIVTRAFFAGPMFTGPVLRGVDAGYARLSTDFALGCLSGAAGGLFANARQWLRRGSRSGAALESATWTVAFGVLALTGIDRSSHQPGASLFFAAHGWIGAALTAALGQLVRTKLARRLWPSDVAVAAVIAVAWFAGGALTRPLADSFPRTSWPLFTNYLVPYTICGALIGLAVEVSKARDSTSTR